jgi:hypothetical protein
LTEENKFTAPLNAARFHRENRDIPKTQIPLDGRQIDVYTYKDALNYAHTVGLFKVTSNLLIELCNPLENHYVAKATVLFTDGTEFDAIGDANPKNVNVKVAKHMPRMAETRAVGRALGKALNLDANFKDEFGGDDKEESSITYSVPAPKASAKPAIKPTGNTVPPNDGGGGYECEDCGKEIKDSQKYTASKLAEFSIKGNNGKILCYNCSHPKN